MFIVIDYARHYFASVAKMSVPDKLSGKFVQIRKGKTEYLIFAPTVVAPYHADIVERFCFEKGLGGSSGGEGKRFDIREPGWVVVGGGKFEMDRARKSIRLYGDSKAYGAFDAKRLKEKIPETEELSEYEVDLA